MRFQSLLVAYASSCAFVNLFVRPFSPTSVRSPLLRSASASWSRMRPSSCNTLVKERGQFSLQHIALLFLSNPGSSLTRCLCWGTVPLKP